MKIGLLKNKKCSGKYFQQAFTLIELLVVVSIMALLVSILLPALAQARDRARDVICMTRQHNLYLAFATYAAEHEGLSPERGSYMKANELFAGDGDDDVIDDFGDIDLRRTLKTYLDEKMESFNDPLCRTNVDLSKSWARIRIEGHYGFFTNYKIGDSKNPKFGTPLTFNGQTFHIMTSDWIAYKLDGIQDTDYHALVQTVHKGRNNSMVLNERDEKSSRDECWARYDTPTDSDDFGNQKYNYSYCDGSVRSVRFGVDDVVYLGCNMQTYIEGDEPLYAFYAWNGRSGLLSNKYCTFLPAGK